MGKKEKRKAIKEGVERKREKEFVKKWKRNRE